MLVGMRDWLGDGVKLVRGRVQTLTHHQVMVVRGEGLAWHWVGEGFLFSILHRFPHHACKYFIECRVMKVADRYD